jgi:hypothetical protein
VSERRWRHGDVILMEELEGERVIRRVEAREWPFNEPWPDWRPDPSWAAPQIRDHRSPP